MQSFREKAVANASACVHLLGFVSSFHNCLKILSSLKNYVYIPIVHPSQYYVHPSQYYSFCTFFVLQVLKDDNGNALSTA
jgi:hypothetical protein